MGAVAGAPSVEGVRAAAAAAEPLMREVRRALHEHPEIGLELPRTVATIREALATFGVEAQGCGGGLVVVLGDPDPAAPAVALRADMDALPLQESADAEPRSRVDGAMHACGHDLHSATLVGVARVLAGLGADLPGRVALIWQPGEEGYEGMQAMLDDGLMELIGEQPVAAYAVHVMADTLPSGGFAGRVGASHASTGSFRAVVRGRGGHAAFPHDAVDPMPAVAELITGLQVAVTRRFNVFDPVVVTVGSVHGGDAPNVIPGEVRLAGTTRTFSAATAARIEPVLREVAAGIAAQHGLEIEVEFEAGYPAVINAADEVASFRDAVVEIVGADRFQELAAPIPAGDDMSRLLERIPGAFFLLGASRPEPHGPAAPNHSSAAYFDESALGDGAAVLAWAAYSRLAAAR